jgi:hypothetical protein
MMRYRAPATRRSAPVDHRRRIERRVAELLVLREQDAVLLLTTGCALCPCEEGETAVVVMRPDREAQVVKWSRTPDKISDRDIIEAIGELAV